MKRLRTHITFTNIAAGLALFFALGGSAYAANRYLITSTKQISPKVLASLKGKSGANGKNGANGAQGPAGAQGSAGNAGSQGVKGETGTAGIQGPQGTAGATGTQGIQGIQGIQGNSVTNKPLAANNGSGKCEEGGAEFKVGTGTPSYACNGRTGFTKTLPAGETETGTWTLAYNAAGAGEEPRAAVSFSIPLSPEVAGEPKAVHAEFVEAPSAECPGSVSSPSAEPGFLCVYKFSLTNLHEPSVFDMEGQGGATFGAILGFETEAAGAAIGWGSWAVTAPTS
jgi:Collagen triple helix repeat (20 copies)